MGIPFYIVEKLFISHLQVVAQFLILITKLIKHFNYSKWKYINSVNLHSLHVSYND